MAEFDWDHSYTDYRATTAINQQPKHVNLILASSSPRRRQLLTAAGYRFTVDPPNESVESSADRNLSARRLVALLAFEKAKDVAGRIDQGIILSADTIAECNAMVLGKPKDRQDAENMLKSLSGQVHFVHTAVCLWSKPGNHKILKTDTTELEMNELSQSVIEKYLDSGLWMGKAGAFGYQDDLPWIRIRSGSESNVVGLPMELLEEMLAELDYTGGT